MDWFRFYNDARSDNKLKLLTDSEFRVWVNLLCLASEQTEQARGTIDGTDRFVLAAEVAHADETLLVETLAKLVKLRMISDDHDVIRFAKWDKRQFASDSSTSRVQKHRDKLRNGEATESNDDETLQEQHATPPDTETDTDTKTENQGEKPNTRPPASASDYSSEFLAFWAAYPRHIEKPKAWKAWNARLKERIAAEDMTRAASHYAQICTAHQTEGRFIKHPATFLGKDKPFEDYLLTPTAEDLQPRAAPMRPLAPNSNRDVIAGFLAKVTQPKEAPHDP